MSQFINLGTDSEPQAIRRASSWTFEDLKPFAPNLILTHYKADHHQDHRIDIRAP